MHSEKILIVDDENIILELAREILRPDYDVTTTDDGEKCVKLLGGERYDLLLTDIMMPGIDGLDVIRRVRAGNREMPVIIITAHGTLDMAMRAMRLGANGFVLKPFTPMDLRIAVSEALEKARLLKENIRLKTLMPLFEVSKEIIGEVDPKRLVNRILTIVAQETRAEQACLCLLNESGGVGMMEIYNSSPEADDEMKESRERMIKAVLSVRGPVFITPGAEVPDGFECLAPGANGVHHVFMPLAVRGIILGILHVQRTGASASFSHSEIDLLSVLSGQAAAAMENARLYEKLQQSYLSMIVTLSGVVESRDLYTDAHMKDIAEYSEAIARKLALPENTIDDIRKAALLHDLGKICVPDRILMKADKLSKEEMDIIRKHPVDGARIIDAVEPIRHSKRIIRHHHESFDGSGYPDGLKGEEIPLGSRIISVADAFGAMTTDRPYRKALSVSDAVRELRRYALQQFDPEVVDIFIALLKEKGILGADEGRADN